MNPESHGPPSWSVERRLALIAARLQWERRINRNVLVARFGISPNQASADLKRFQALHPGSLVYDARAKTYRAGPGLPAATDGETATLLRDLRLVAEGVLPGDETPLTTLPGLALADAPARATPADVLGVVLRAIRGRLLVEADYQSFSAAEPRMRRIEPHALVFDGFRWHCRARDAEDGAFKDFVLGRLREAQAAGPASGDPAADGQWHTIIALVIGPHPGLTPAQCVAIEMDYGMTDGRLVIRCREAVAYYVRRRLGLTDGHALRPAADQHIVLWPEASA